MERQLGGNVLTAQHGTLGRMKRVLTLSLLALLVLPQASAQTAQEIVSRVDQTQKNARDVSFRMTGRMMLDGGSQNMDVQVRALPTLGAARMEFRQPQSLSGDVIVSDRREVRQYWSISNQITVTPVSRAASQAASQVGLGGGSLALDFAQLGSVTSLASNFNVQLLGTSSAGGGSLYRLKATPKQGKDAGTAQVWVTSQGWRPTRVQLFDSQGKLMVDLNVTNFKTNSGLTEAALRLLPRGARVVQQ